MIRRTIHDFEDNPKSPKRDWFDHVFNYSKKHCQKDNLDILEIGSAYGRFVHYANSLGHRAIGTEISEEYANSSTNLIKGNVMNIKNQEYRKYFSEEIFDLIYMEHVFEHFLEPNVELKQLVPLLKQTGIFFISLPNHKSFLAKIYRLRWSWVNPPIHLYYFNEKAIKELFIKNDLEIIHSWTGDYFRSIYQFYSIGFFRNSIKKLINKLLKTNLEMTKYSYKYPKTLADRFFILPYWLLLPILRWSHKHKMGSELVIIARRKANSSNI